MFGNCLCSKTHRFSILSSASISWRVSRYTSRYAVPTVKGSRDLPWIQHTKDTFKKEPLRHRALGVFIFRMFLRLAGTQFGWKDLSYGAVEAIKTIADCVSKHDANNELQHYLGPTLLRQYKNAFEQLSFENKKIELEIETPERLHISGARFVLGEVDPGDEYVFNICGQSFILSKRDIEEFEQEHHNPKMVDGFMFGKKFSQEALMKKMRFQIDIKFELLERYSLWEMGDKEHNSKSINRDAMKVYHRWKFESLISPTEKFPLDWYVVDVDDFLKTKYLIPEDRKDGI